MKRGWTIVGALGAALCVVTPAMAQNLPAGLGGYWKITKMIPKKPRTVSGCMANPSFFGKAARNSMVLISDRNIVWGSASATDPGTTVRMVPPEQFQADHSGAGVTLHDLELDNGSQIQVIHLATPGSLPFDTIVMLDPSTVYFERCGIFMQAIHSSGFVAPPLPNQ
jgi:hypothetical protein